jgi:hypothetical protein
MIHLSVFYPWGRRHDHRQLEIKSKGNGLMRLRRPGQGQK